MIVLIHSSKTMRTASVDSEYVSTPEFINQAKVLDTTLKLLSVAEIADVMHISNQLAVKTQVLIKRWTDAPTMQRAAIDSFLGDIYSGLQVQTWSMSDRLYADKHLRILSGLYGTLRPLDGIYPYRLEMGYKLRVEDSTNLYQFWGGTTANSLDANVPIINLSSLEYSKVITKYTDSSRIISPAFLTINPKTTKPTFVAVHAKIARGAFAGWLIKNQVEHSSQLKQFQELGYTYRPDSSTPNAPMFICEKFLGLGLSVRLS